MNNLNTSEGENVRRIAPAKTRFHHLTNEELVRRINSDPDFGWDDEGVELSRRMEAGTIRVEMQYNTLVIL